MKIIRATLYTHGEWFKLQMCKDHFEGLLKIDFLKDISSHQVRAASKSSGDTCNQSSSQVTVTSSSRMQEDGCSPTEDSSTRDIPSDESAILKVMVSSEHLLQWEY